MHHPTGLQCLDAYSAELLPNTAGTITASIDEHRVLFIVQLLHALDNADELVRLEALQDSALDRVASC